MFKNGDVSAKKGVIGYRYTSPDPAPPTVAFALVSVDSGFKKRTEKGIKDIGMWAYTPRPCVQPLSSDGQSKVAWIYQREIRVCDGVKPTEAAKRMNRSRPADRIKCIRHPGCPTSRPGLGGQAPTTPRTVGT